MRGKSILLLPIFFLSCIGNLEDNPDSSVQADNPIKQIENFEQISVVDTDFGDSHIFRSFLESREEGPVIPGLTHKLVPQGIAFRADQSQMIISGYMSDGTAGILAMLNMDKGSLTKVLFLHNADGSAHTGHLGGLAVSTDLLWIASDSGVYGVSFNKIDAAENSSTLILPEIIETETKGSFAASSNRILWVGEFTRKDGSFPASEEHRIVDRKGKNRSAWLAGYRLETINRVLDELEGRLSKLQPDFILSIPDEIQGAVITEKEIFLSASFGRKIDSRLHIYANPLNESPHRIILSPEGKEIPLWFLDGKNLSEKITMPPMSEGLTLYNNALAVLFESAAAEYRDTARLPLDRIQLLSR